MRGTRWLAAGVLALLVLVPTSLQVAAQEPTPRETTRFAPDATRLVEFTGQSALHFRGACMEDGVTCVGDSTSDDGTFFLEAAAQAGHVVVSWRAVNDSLRVLRVRVAGLMVEGESPLRVDFEGLEAGRHSIELEPARRVVGYHEQVADWSASFVVTAPPETIEARGHSYYQARLGCVLDLCDAEDRIVSDSVVVPWSARGTLVAEWDPRDGPMRVSIPGTDFVVQGDTPLALDVSGLPAGEWIVEVRGPTVSLPLLAGTEVAWTLTLARA